MVKEKWTAIKRFIIYFGNKSEKGGPIRYLLRGVWDPTLNNVPRPISICTEINNQSATF